MDNIETLHNKIMVVAETVGSIFEADLFKSVPMIRGFGCHGQHWHVSPQENSCCRNRWFQIRSRPFQIRTDYHRFWLSWTTLRRFTIRKWLLWKLFVSDSKQTSWISTDDLRLSLSLATLRVFAIKNGFCRNRWIQIRSRPLQISTDDLRPLLSWTTLKRFTIK